MSIFNYIITYSGTGSFTREAVRRAGRRSHRCGALDLCVSMPGSHACFCTQCERIIEVWLPCLRLTRRSLCERNYLGKSICIVLSVGHVVGDN